MKAKTLANNFKTEGFTANSLTEIILDLSREPDRIVKERKIGHNNPRAIVAVFNEINTKWKAFVRRVNDMPEFTGCLKDKTFEECYRELIPEIGPLLDRLRECV